jgi:hypothetical protein
MNTHRSQRSVDGCSLGGVAAVGQHLQRGLESFLALLLRFPRPRRLL